MRLKVIGANERLKLIFKLVVYWSIGIVIFLAGTFHGRWLERACWETALQEVGEEYKTLDTLEKIILAESNAKHKNVWGQNGEYGICQMKKGTFFWLAEKSHLFDYDRPPDWKSQEDQIRLLNWSIRNGYANHWSTFRKIEK